MKTYESSLDALNAGIAKSHEEIAALTLDLKKLADLKIEKLSVKEGHPQKGPSKGGNGHDGWTDFRHKLGEAGVRGGKVAKGFADEIERHPLLGGAAAFGLGFAIAALIFRRSGKDSED